MRIFVRAVFFFKQKTAYEISVRDWSSDVCSSDLGHGDVHERRRALAPALPMVRAPGAFADRVQAQVADQIGCLREGAARRQAQAQPLRNAGTLLARRRQDSFSDAH